MKKTSCILIALSLLASLITIRAFAEELKTLDMSTLEKEVPEIEETNALKDQSSQLVNNVVKEEFTENNEKCSIDTSNIIITTTFSL